MGLINWLMKGIGFEDEQETDEQALALAEQKRIYRENKKQEKMANKIKKQEAKNMTFQKFQPEEDLNKPEEEVLDIKSQVEPRETVFAPQNAQMSGFRYDSNGQPQMYNGYDNPSYAQTTMAGYGNKNVIFFYPKKYSEVQHLIDYLKRGESVLLNLVNISDEEAQRMLDFASGAVYALSGSIKRVSGNIFLLTPEGLGIVNAND